MRQPPVNHELFRSAWESAGGIPFIVRRLSVPDSLGAIRGADSHISRGIGVGHIAFYSLFVMAGSRLGADLFSLFIVIRFISALPGLFYFLLISRQVRERQPAATQG